MQKSASLSNATIRTLLGSLAGAGVGKAMSEGYLGNEPMQTDRGRAAALIAGSLGGALTGYRLPKAMFKDLLVVGPNGTLVPKRAFKGVKALLTTMPAYGAVKASRLMDTKRSFTADMSGAADHLGDALGQAIEDPLSVTGAVVDDTLRSDSVKKAGRLATQGAVDSFMEELNPLLKGTVLPMLGGAAAGGLLGKMLGSVVSPYVYSENQHMTSAEAYYQAQRQKQLATLISILGAHAGAAAPLLIKRYAQKSIDKQASILPKALGGLLGGAYGYGVGEGILPGMSEMETTKGKVFSTLAGAAAGATLGGRPYKTARLVPGKAPNLPPVIENAPDRAMLLGNITAVLGLPGLLGKLNDHKKSSIGRFRTTLGDISGRDEEGTQVKDPTKLHENAAIGTVADRVGSLLTSDRVVKAIEDSQPTTREFIGAGMQSLTNILQQELPKTLVSTGLGAGAGYLLPGLARTLLGSKKPTTIQEAVALENRQRQLRLLLMVLGGTVGPWLANADNRQILATLGKDLFKGSKSQIGNDQK